MLRRLQASRGAPSPLSCEMFGHTTFGSDTHTHIYIYIYIYMFPGISRCPQFLPDAFQMHSDRLQMVPDVCRMLLDASQMRPGASQIRPCLPHTFHIPDVPDVAPHVSRSPPNIPHASLSRSQSCSPGQGHSTSCSQQGNLKNNCCSLRCRICVSPYLNVCTFNIYIYVYNIYAYTCI